MSFYNRLVLSYYVCCQLICFNSKLIKKNYPLFVGSVSLFLATARLGINQVIPNESFFLSWKFSGSPTPLSATLSTTPSLLVLLLKNLPLLPLNAYLRTLDTSSFTIGRKDRLSSGRFTSSCGPSNSPYGLSWWLFARLVLSLSGLQ